MINRTLALSLSLVMGAAVNAAPAPVTDLNGESIDSRVATLERILKSRTDAQHRIQGQLNQIQDEVDELRGTLELHNHQLEKILERQRELYLEIDKRIEAVMAQPSVPAVNPTVASPTSTDSSYVTTESENDAYDRAVNLILKDKQYDQAIPEFQAFLLKYPSSSFAPNAHYWLGQLLFNKQDWAGAGEQFEILSNGYPDSTKRADALFKLGVVEQKRSNIARARQLFEQVMSEYPDSSSRKLAETRLKNLN